MTSPVHVERRRGLVHVRLDAPASRNALSLQLMGELLEAVRASASSAGCRGLVIDHEGPVFSAGVDVKERRALPPGGANHSEVLATLYRALWDHPTPVLCRVAGAARGGALGFLACADATVATAEATFAFSEVRIGVAPALVGAIAMAKLGPGRLAPWLLSGEPFGTPVAAEVGLVTHVAAGDGVAELEALVDGLTLAAPTAVATTKALTRRFVTGDVPALIDEMTALSAQLFASDEAAEGMAAFAEKRHPSWSN